MTDAELIDRAVAGEVIGDGQRQIQLLADGWKHFERFVSLAATCKRENTHGWMRLMLEALNDAAARLDPDKYFETVGDASYFVMRACPRSENP